jgi:hypothetical protein
MEFLSPPYMTATRPTVSDVPSKLLFGKKLTVKVTNLAQMTDNAEADVSIVLVDPGYHTHGVGVNQKLVELETTAWPSNGNIEFKTTPDGTYMAPGYAWLYVVIKGVPSTGTKVMVGDGQCTLSSLRNRLTRVPGSDPPSSTETYAAMMSQTAESGGRAIWA